MTAKAALAKALLDGNVLNVKNVFNTIGLTNAAREISRMIENPKTGFGVEISRTPMTGTSKYGQPVTWVNYFLRKSEHNAEGIAKMRAYIAENWQMKNVAKKPKEKPQAATVINNFKQESIFDQ